MRKKIFLALLFLLLFYAARAQTDSTRADSLLLLQIQNQLQQQASAPAPHALFFVDMPNAYVRFFGEEGLNDEGISVSWLLPNHAFFQELTLELTDGPRDNPSFARSTENNYLRLVKLKNFWDLTSNATLELGLTGISGANSSGNNTNIGAVDL